MRLSLPKFIKPFLEYLKGRKLTFVIFVFCLAMTVVLLFIAYGYYIPKNRPLTYAGLHLLSPNAPYTIKLVRVQMEYNPVGQDRMEIGIWFNKAENNSSSQGMNDVNRNYFQLVHSSNVDPYETDFSRYAKFYNGIKEEDDSRQYHKNSVWRYYRFEKTDFPTNIPAPVLTQTFQGNIFKVSEQDIDLEFQFDSDIGSAYPIEVFVFGISDLNLDQVFPEPKEKHNYALIYNLESGKGIESLSTSRIRIRGMDKNKASSIAFKTFFVGLLLGIFVSILITIMLDVVKYYEEPRISTPKKRGIVRILRKTKRRDESHSSSRKEQLFE
jgi:hypothetical protein